MKKNCPICGLGKNSKEQGGNENCFHCDHCWYVECEYTDKEVLEIIKKRLNNN